MPDGRQNANEKRALKTVHEPELEPPLKQIPAVVCQCLLLEDEHGLALIDSGIGLLDVRHPVDRLGQKLIDMLFS